MDPLRPRYRVVRHRASSRLILAVVLCVAALLAASTPASARPGARPRQSHTEASHERRARFERERAPRDKAPKRVPARPLSADVAGTVVKATTAAGAAAPVPQATVTPLAAAADTTAPTGPTQVTVTTQSTVSISAQWDAAQDPESGIKSYAFGIGTVPTGTYSTLANVRWWQITYGTSVAVSLTLDPSLTYYVSVYATNNAGLIGPIVTSAAVHPAAQVLGQAGNVMQIQFAPTGLTANGTPAAGFTSDQTTRMTTFFNRMYPLLVQLYGPPAVSHTVKIVRDLRYHNSNIYFPSLDEIHMADGFYPQLFTHELLHAFRAVFLLSSNASWNYDSTLSGFEESFAQGVSYDAMNAYVAAYPNDTIVPGNTLWGSSNDWDYDYQNTTQLRGTDFWSDGGGTGLYWLRYEMGASAIRKIQIESPGFYARFNQEYYRRINANPTTVRPTRALMVDIIKTLVPTIEGVPADQWINAQHIFFAQNVYGKKIFNKIQDYPYNDFFAFQNIYFLDTMHCGSEWACWDGTKWVYYDLNGSQGSGRLLDNDGSTVWSGPMSIQPAQNPSDGYMAFGAAVKNLTTASSLLPWPGGDPNDYVMNLTSFGLYRFESTFVDAATNTSTSNSIYRVMGTPMTQNFSGVYGGIVGPKNGTIYIDHEGYPSQPGIPVARGAFAGTRSWTGIPNARTGGRDSVPGRVFITFVDSDTGSTYRAQRNIDYGSATGSQMFLLDFSSAAPVADVVPPSVTITAPAAGARVGGSVSITANASDNVAVSRVDFLVDGTIVGNDTTSPYAISWNADAATLANHTITAKAYDTSNRTATAAGVTVRVVDLAVPTVTITSPTNGSRVWRSSTVTIAASASDNRGVARVVFYVNNSQKCSDTTSAYSCKWSVPSARNVVYTLRARAYDATGNFSDRTITVTSR